MNTIIGIYQNKADAIAAADALHTAGIDWHYMHFIAEDEVKNMGDFHPDAISRERTGSLSNEEIDEMLEKAGFEEGDVSDYRQKAREGKVILIARAMAYQEESVVEIARRHDPVQVEEKDLIWREDYETTSTINSSPQAPTSRQFYVPPIDDFAANFQGHYKSEDKMEDDFDAYMPAYRYGYELAVESDLRGQTWAEVEARASEGWKEDRPWDELKGAVKHAWQAVRQELEGDEGEAQKQDLGYGERRSTFHDHYNRHYAPQGLPFERYEAAYYFGTVLGEDARYQERPWSKILPVVQERWQRDHPDEGNWDDVSEAVRYGWRRAQEEDTELME